MNVSMQKFIFIPFYTISSVFVSLSLVWLLLFQTNFFYGFWHDYGGIKENIEFYAPKNHFITSFELTNKQERVYVFQQINNAVHMNANELSNIVFSTPIKSKIQLLHADEIQHLQDVAMLIKKLYKGLLAMFVIWLITLVYAYKKSLLLPSLKKQLTALLFIIALIVLIIILLGPTNVFYALHEVVFTKGVPWFFYYEESLMSTIMAAPTLFGWIALSYLILLTIIFPLMQYTVLRSFNKLQLLRLTNLSSG